MFFTDSKDKTWTIELDIPSARRVRSMTGFDLVGRDIGRIGEAIDHPIDGVDILYALVEPDAREENISLDDFYNRMCVDLEPIAVSLVAEIRDFFLRRGQATMAAAWTEIVRQTQTPGTLSTGSQESSE